MKIKKDDTVLVISGKDRGKKGKVLQIFLENNRIVIEGVNKLYKHLKQRKGKEKGERVEFNAPLAASNVMFFCSKCSKPTRIGVKIENKKKTRFCKKCNKVI
ncbi:MAG: 50S ribosomal protein L24 [Parcubacteria group bacterium]|nr:50S ribosomal protein L24 [Parcubacteria group bacterium]